jgi:hypothetical protein
MSAKPSLSEFYVLSRNRSIVTAPQVIELLRRIAADYGMDSTYVIYLYVKVYHFNSINFIRYFLDRVYLSEPSDEEMYEGVIHAVGVDPEYLCDDVSGVFPDEGPDKDDKLLDVDEGDMLELFDSSEFLQDSCMFELCSE